MLSSKIYFLIVSLLACLAIIISINRFSRSPGIDFYQYWGVIKARQWSLGRLKSPAAEQEKYAEFLNDHVTQASSKQLRDANKVRRELQLLQTPLCYTTFKLLPANFSLAFGIFQTIQVILFLSALLMLSAIYYGNWLRLLPWGLLMIIFYGPLVSDLRVGNLNCFYLFGFASLLGLADRVLGKPASGSAMGASMGFMAIIIFLTLMKPNWSLVTVLLAAYLWADRGMAGFARVAAAGAAFGAVLLIWPCFQFGSWMVWQDWYSYMQRWDSVSMLVRVPERNYAPVLLVTRILGSSVLTAVILLGAVLAASLFIALMMGRGTKESFHKGMARAAIRSLRDPNLTMATGITVTLLLSPLVWFHYYLVSLIPASWLLSPIHPWRQANRAAWISIILTSGIIIDFMRQWFGFTYTLTYATVVLGLVPLWAGVLAAIAGQKNYTESEVSGAVLIKGERQR